MRHILVRFNTDLKQVYRYYAAHGCAAEDAFALSLEQFRTFVVDAGLASATMPLATLGTLAMRACASQPVKRPLPRRLVRWARCCTSW